MEARYIQKKDFKILFNYKKDNHIKIIITFLHLTL